MLVYWDRARVVDPRTELIRLRRADPVDLLIGLGELESGLADALPDGDPIVRAFRRASIAAASSGNADLDALLALPLPARVTTSIPEGYAYYGLFPDTYRQAAADFCRECAPERVAVVGIRSIGASLSAVVAAALAAAGCQVASWTVRPRGHPFSRTLPLTPEQEREWRAFEPAWWAIVDEGPGLSGSSFASVASRLSELGVPDTRIVLFPSWAPSGDGFVSADARERWRRHRKYCREFALPPDLHDLSAGAWRRSAYAAESEWPAVQPQHERRKLLEDGRVLWKFAGLGRYGRSRLERAEALWRAGFGPRPLGLENGFLRMEWVAGRPVRQMTTALADTMARYLAFVRDAFPPGDGAPPALLREMARVNAGIEVELPDDAPRSAIDGRMLPQEWIETRSGYLKADALDHHDDHFLPGSQNIAWDVAGAAVEFGVDALSERLGVTKILDPYLKAYRAFRLGYATLAARALAGSRDAERFEASMAAYRGDAASPQRR